MRRPRLDLSFEEGQVLRELILGRLHQEVRLLVLLQNARLVLALRTDTGPILDLPSSLYVKHARELRVLEAAKGVDRIVTFEVDRVGRGAFDGIWEGILDGSIHGDPPWLPVVERVRAWPARLRAVLQRLLPDGSYAVFLERDDARPPALVCARLEAGRVVELTGAEGLGLDVSLAEPSALQASIERRVGQLRLLLSGSHAALSQVVGDPHPASALEHASIRAQVRILRIAAPLRLGLFLARLLGL